MTNIDDQIWITSRVRMISERKSIRNQNLSYLYITYYSLFTIILSVFADLYKHTYPLLDEINISSSVVVLVFSLVAGGFRFESRGNIFRECYIKLQKIGGNDLSPENKAAEYYKILEGYPNHSEKDYYDFIVQHTYWEGKELTSGGKAVVPTKYIWLSYLFRHLTYYFLVIVLFVLPLMFLIWPFVQGGACK